MKAETEMQVLNVNGNLEKLTYLSQSCFELELDSDSASVPSAGASKHLSNGLELFSFSTG